MEPLGRYETRTRIGAMKSGGRKGWPTSAEKEKGRSALERGIRRHHREGDFRETRHESGRRSGVIERAEGEAKITPAIMRERSFVRGAAWRSGFHAVKVVQRHDRCHLKGEQKSQP
jgi:hypothetical protein